VVNVLSVLQPLLGGRGDCSLPPKFPYIPLSYFHSLRSFPFHPTLSLPLCVLSPPFPIPFPHPTSPLCFPPLSYLELVRNDRWLSINHVLVSRIRQKIGARGSLTGLSGRKGGRAWVRSNQHRSSPLLGVPWLCAKHGSLNWEFPGHVIAFALEVPWRCAELGTGSHLHVCKPPVSGSPLDANLCTGSLLEVC
jgi:hypothetical protein